MGDEFIYFVGWCAYVNVIVKGFGMVEAGNALLGDTHGEVFSRYVLDAGGMLGK